MLGGKNLTEFTNLFSPNNFKKNDDIKLKSFYEHYLKNEINVFKVQKKY